MQSYPIETDGFVHEATEMTFRNMKSYLRNIRSKVLS